MTTPPPSHRIDLSQPAAMRAVLTQLLHHADLAGFDRRGRPIVRIQTSVPLWLLDELLVFGSEDEDLEEDDPAEDEEGG
ncbi:hypothetical protein [Geminicoccus roseus]|uniref:hypothetical protein n=1 Tax=Geminicoccus roseus TaxID=404900 RepID=UPI0003FA5CF0|nr:hypothetical protein [Geminicoccus roseus]